jgi:hypothetical protein
MKMDDHRLSYHIRMAEFTGTLCSGDLLPMKATYALTANKVKSQGAIDRDEALMRFTRKYFQSRQPVHERIAASISLRSSSMKGRTFSLVVV